MKYINKKRKTISIIIIILVVLLLPIGIVNTKGNASEKVIEEFKSRGKLVSTETVIKNDKSYTIEYYSVKKEFEYEDVGRRINNGYTDSYIGAIGDIYLTSSDLAGTFITKWFFDKTKASHAGIVYSGDGTKTVEIVGNNKKENNVVKIYDNDWLTQTGLPEVIVLRSKSVNSQNENDIVKVLDEKLGSKYNYMIPFKSKNKYYCSDLVTRTIKDVTNVNINKKNNIVTGANIILSDDTYLIYYCEKVNDKNIDYRVYILEDN